MNLIDGKYYTIDTFGKSLDFLLEKNLIIKKYNQFKVKFVGIVIDHINNEKFISYPKNTNFNIDLDFIFNNFSNLKQDNNILLTNICFDRNGNQIYSEYSYYRKFLSIFSDYLTNDFLLPNKKIYSNKGTKVDIIKTIQSLSKSNKITYKNDDKRDFHVRNVFYTILKKLEKKYSCPNEKKIIEESTKFYQSKGYIFKEYDECPDNIGFVEVNHKSLLALSVVKDYLNYSKKSKEYEINVFYTDKFEYVYEYMLKKILKHIKDYKNQCDWYEPSYKKSNIDIYNHYFMGDCKYYNLDKIDSYSFTKELYEYNLCRNNEMNNYVFIPGQSNRIINFIYHGEFKLILYEMSCDDIINDIKNKTYNLFGLVKSTF